MRALRAPAILAIAIVLSGCAASTRESAIRSAIAALDVSSTALVVYDKEHQESIVSGATSLDDGKAKLAAYRAKREVVRKAFVVAGAAIGVAATLNDDHSMAGMQLALKQVLDAVTALTGGAP